MLPTGSGVAVAWLRLSCWTFLKECGSAQPGLKAMLGVQPLSCQLRLISQCGSLTPRCRTVSWSGWTHCPVWNKFSFILRMNDHTQVFTSKVQAEFCGLSTPTNETYILCVRCLSHFIVNKSYERKWSCKCNLLCEISQTPV